MTAFLCVFVCDIHVRFHEDRFAGYFVNTLRSDKRSLDPIFIGCSRVMWRVHLCVVTRHKGNDFCFVQHLDTAIKQNKGSLSVWRVTRAHATRQQPMDTGPYGQKTLKFESDSTNIFLNRS